MATLSGGEGFEVDIIRREHEGENPHRVKLSAEDEDFWVLQARRANVLVDRYLPAGLMPNRPAAHNPNALVAIK